MTSLDITGYHRFGAKPQSAHLEVCPDRPEVAHVHVHWPRPHIASSWNLPRDALFAALASPRWLRCDLLRLRRHWTGALDLAAPGVARPAIYRIPSDAITALVAAGIAGPIPGRTSVAPAAPLFLVA